MKKFKPILIIATVFCLFVAVLSGCSNTTKGGSAKGSTDIHMTDPSFGFISAEIYDHATEENPFTKDMLTKRTVLNADTEYCLFINFTLTSARNNDGQSLLKVNFTFDALNVMNGTMEDVSTGLIEEMKFQDAATGNIGKTTTLSFKVPPLSAEPKNIEMIVRLKPVMVGESHIIFGYDYDADGDYKVLGTDGKTTNLKIQPVKIETPRLSVNDMGWISWNHVKNADYYCIFRGSNEKPLSDFDGETIFIKATSYTVGDTITYNLSQILFDYQIVRIRAFSNKGYGPDDVNKEENDTTVNILASSYSNNVEHVWG